MFPYDEDVLIGRQLFGESRLAGCFHESLSEAWKIVEAFRRKGIRMSVSSREDLDMKKNPCKDLIDLADMKYQVQWWNPEYQKYEPPVYGLTPEEAIVKAAVKILGDPKFASRVPQFP